MTRDEVWTKLCEVIREVFDNDKIVLNEDSVVMDIDGWDSMNHVNLFVQIENAFGIRIPSSAIARVHQVRDMIEIVQNIKFRS